VKRFAIRFLIVNALIAAVVGAIGWAAEWKASDYTPALLVVFGLAVFASIVSLGSSGSTSNVGGGAMTDAIGPGSVSGTPAGAMGGVFGMAVDDAATSESVRWQEAQQETPGPRTFVLPLATSLTTGVAALVSWKVFE
jgi:hypothetical protein